MTGEHTEIEFLRADGSVAISYGVTLDKRYGFPTREEYDAEVMRLIRLGVDTGTSFKVTVTKGN